ncbi:MAG: PAS domain-containing protein [Verrucomicrobia bacterium]|nr:PAS domain-containing protein [Verrucomicrobiota bacterium]
MPEPTPRKSTNRLAVPAVDGLAEDPFDRLTRMASRLLAAPIAAVSFTGKIAMRLRSQIGLGGRDLPETLLRATLMGGEPLLISDAKADPRFATDPALGGSTPLRAYGGVPLRRPDGAVTGVFCVLDRSPRPFTPDQVKTLKYLAAIAEDEIAKGAGDAESAAAPAATPAIDPNGMPSARPGESVEVAEMRRLFSSLDTPVFIHHSLDDGLGSAINGVNDAACDLLGYTRGSLLKSSITELFFHSHPGWLEEIDRMLAMPCDVVFKILLRSAVGAPIPVEVNTRLVQNAGPIRAYTVITRLAEERGSAQPGDGPPIAETAQGLLCRFQPDGTLTFVNDAYCEYYGEERRALEGFIFRPPTVDADRAISQDTIDSIRPEHPTATCEFRVFGRDGRAGWQRWTYTGLFDDTGRIIEYQALGNGFHREMATVLPVPPLPLPEPPPPAVEAEAEEPAESAAPATGSARSHEPEPAAAAEETVVPAAALPTASESSESASDTVADGEEDTHVSATALIATAATEVSTPTPLHEPAPAAAPTVLEPEPPAPPASSVPPSPRVDEAETAPASFASEPFPTAEIKPASVEPADGETKEVVVAAEPTATPPEPAARSVEPTTAAVAPEPAEVAPAPAAVEPAPVLVAFEPKVIEPEPAAVPSEQPAAVAPEPAAVAPEPGAVAPEVASAEPEPVPVASAELPEASPEVSPTSVVVPSLAADVTAPEVTSPAEIVAAPASPAGLTAVAPITAPATTAEPVAPPPTSAPAPRGQPLQDDTIPAAILDAIDDGVFVASVAEQRLVYLNHGAQKLTGRHASAFLAAPDLWKEVFHEDDEPQLRRALKMLLEQNRAEATARVVRPNGEIVWVQLRTRLVHDEESQVPRIEGVVRDVTERRRAEDALRASEAKFRDMALNTPGVVFQWHEREGGHSGFTYMSPRLQELFAIPAEEAHTLVDRIHSSDREQWRQALAAVRTNPGPWSFEGRLVCPDGRVRWLQCAAKPVRYSPGDLLFNGVMLDITERRRTEGELRASEERFRLVLQASHDGIWDWDLTSRRVYYSDRWKEMLGFRSGELTASREEFWSRLHPDDRDRALAAMRAYVEKLQ